MTKTHIPSDTFKTLGAAIEYCVAAMEEAGVFFGHGTDNAWDEAVQLVLSVTQEHPDADRSVLQQSLSSEQCRQINALLEQRTVERVPLPYLLGQAWFAGLRFRCDRRAIIPRSPIAELILNDFQPWYCGPEPGRILDLCCGSGCIGLASAYHQPNAMVDLVDLDPDALALAAENRQEMGLTARVSIIQSDLFAELGTRCYDIILCNPPYVDEEDLSTMPNEYHHEPELALGSGADGLLLTRQIFAEVGSYLAPHGLLVMEVGNSWEALERAFPAVPFTWLEFERGGHGVLAMSASDLKEFSASFIL